MLLGDPLVLDLIIIVAFFPMMFFQSTEESLSEKSESEEFLDDEIRNVTGDDNESTKSEGVDLVHPNEVLKALRAFVEETKKANK